MILSRDNPPRQERAVWGHVCDHCEKGIEVGAFCYYIWNSKGKLWIYCDECKSDQYTYTPYQGVVDWKNEVEGYVHGYFEGLNDAVVFIAAEDEWFELGFASGQVFASTPTFDAAVGFFEVVIDGYVLDRHNGVIKPGVTFESYYKWKFGEEPR